MMQLTLPERSTKDLKIFKIQRMEVFNGPIGALLNIKANYMTVDEDKSIRLFQDCIDDDDENVCNSLSSEIFGSEVTCIDGIFKGKGISAACNCKYLK